jgi:hypothetical protein
MKNIKFIFVENIFKELNTTEKKYSKENAKLDRFEETYSESITKRKNVLEVLYEKRTKSLISNLLKKYKLPSKNPADELDSGLSGLVDELSYILEKGIWSDDDDNSDSIDFIPIPCKTYKTWNNSFRKWNRYFSNPYERSAKGGNFLSSLACPKFENNVLYFQRWFNDKVGFATMDFSGFFKLKSKSVNTDVIKKHFEFFYEAIELIKTYEKLFGTEVANDPFGNYQKSIEMLYGRNISILDKNLINNFLEFVNAYSQIKKDFGVWNVHRDNLYKTMRRYTAPFRLIDKLEEKNDDDNE